MRRLLLLILFAAGVTIVAQPVFVGLAGSRTYAYDRGLSHLPMRVVDAVLSDASGTPSQEDPTLRGDGLPSSSSRFGAETVDGASGLWIGYHATEPEFAEAIRTGGFRLSEGGRLGGGGVYVSDTAETAVAEFGAHNPGMESEVLRVQHDPGQEYVFDQARSAPYFKGTMPPEWADSLTAPSIQNEGGWNTFILNGSQVVLP
jgi:hypothetical protein